MAFGRIDWDDRLFGAIFLLSSAVSVGLLTVPGTTLFSDTLFTLGSGGAAVAVSISKAISFVALMATIATNRTDFSKLVGVEWWVAIATIGLVVAPPFMPLLDQLISQSVVAGSVAIALQAGGFAIISYLG
jgi:hypothetical protein